MQKFEETSDVGSMSRGGVRGLLLLLPVAPASSKASACTNPKPLAAPDTSTTLSTRLNSGRRFVVPRYVDGSPLRRAAASASGGPVVGWWVG